MKENTQEKNLIEKNENNILCRIKNFFKKIFTKKQKDIQEEVKEEVGVKEDDQFKEYIKITEDEETRLLELQRKYRDGEIVGGDLTDEQIDALSNLYDKQIADLKTAIENTKQKIAKYKTQIEKNNT